MGGAGRSGKSLLFRLVTWVTRAQVGYHLRWSSDPQIVLLVYAVFSGSLALAILTAVAFCADLPLIFPPLGATAFILFHAPLSEVACPRSVVLAHITGLACGLGALALVAVLSPGSEILEPLTMSWARIVAVTVAMALSSALMIALRFVHPPASATALIAALGGVLNAQQVVGYALALFLLVAQAVALSRLIGGIPYPLWRRRSNAAREYGPLAGAPRASQGFWADTADRVIRAPRAARSRSDVRESPRA